MQGFLVHAAAGGRPSVGSDNDEGPPSIQRHGRACRDPPAFLRASATTHRRVGVAAFCCAVSCAVCDRQRGRAPCPYLYTHISWVLAAVRQRLEGAWAAAGPDPRCPTESHRPLTTYAAWFRSMQPAVLKFAGACVERRHVRQAARCMAFRVAQPGLRVTTGRYEGVPYAERACPACQGGVQVGRGARRL